MFTPTDKSGQYVIDTRLDSEKSMEGNVLTMVDFATAIRKGEVSGQKIKNKHEGYGFLADRHQNVTHQIKQVKDGMGDLLNSLASDNDAEAVDKVASLTNSLYDLIQSAVLMAAEARRVSDDLYRESWNEPEKTPLEQYAEENDGFEEPKED